MDHFNGATYPPAILIHGGAANIPDSSTYNNKIDGVKRACKVGYDILQKNGTALDAVQAAVMAMEDNITFNAGYGSSLNADGNVECDAIVIDGKNLNAGAVAGVKNFKNPVSVARVVMEKSNHVVLIGNGANRFANEHQIELVENSTLVASTAKNRLENHQNFLTVIEKAMNNTEHDTVGAVAVDFHGNIAAATSTGGITGKHEGRVGDSPMVGSGAYADNENVAVSTTGHGEKIMRVTLAKHIAMLVDGGNSVQEATHKGIEYMRKKVDGYGGAISINRKGELGIAYSTEHMAWAYVKDKENMHYGIAHKDDFILPLNDMKS